MTAAQRIVCLTEETVETLYLLGEQHRIVGIAGFTVRPPWALTHGRTHSNLSERDHVQRY